jgi:hypothetical protein
MAESPRPVIETRYAQMFSTLQPAEIDRLRRFCSGGAILTNGCVFGADLRPAPWPRRYAFKSFPLTDTTMSRSQR